MLSKVAPKSERTNTGVVFFCFLFFSCKGKKAPVQQTSNGAGARRRCYHEKKIAADVSNSLASYTPSPFTLATCVFSFFFFLFTQQQQTPATPFLIRRDVCSGIVAGVPMATLLFCPAGGARAAAAGYASTLLLMPGAPNGHVCTNDGSNPTRCASDGAPSASGYKAPR